MNRLDSARRERMALGALLGVYLLSAVGFALVTPYGEAPDEFSHLAYVEYLVRFSALPGIGQQFYTNEAAQPPLYYLAGAIVVLVGRGVANERPHTRRLIPPIQPNPEFQPPRSSILALLHPPDQRWLFWPYVLRGFSILLGLGVILLTYQTARVLVPAPAPPAVALISAAFAALIPEANSIRASVSNENLAALMGAWIVLLLALHLARPYNSRRVLWLGAAFGLALLSKLTVSLLVLPVLWVLWVRKPDSLSRLLRDAVRSAALVLALAGPFYLYRWIAYGDPLASSAWAIMLPPDSPWHWTDLFWLQDPFRHALWTSFWGDYGWVLIPMPAWIYWAFLVLTVLAVGGGLALVWRRSLTPTQVAACGMLIMAVLALYATVIFFSLRLIAWQGREMYLAYSSICVLFGFGLAGLVLGRAATQPLPPLGLRARRMSVILVFATASGLFAANVYSIVWLVAPALNGG